MRATVHLPLLLLLMTLTGCGMGRLSTTTADSAALNGHVHGGQQPVAGARVQLLAAGVGTQAYDLTAAHLVTTDAAGAFSITGDYTCPTGTTPVYVVARGGNPGLAPGTNNPALVLLAALGDCGNLSPATEIFIDEVTTVGAAYALNQFFPATLPTGALLNSSATNLAGLRNAFLAAATLSNSGNGTAPGASLPAGTAIEVGKLYSLSNALAPCVNSDGTAGCTALFTAATSSGTVPATTLDAALNILRNPGSNVSAVFDASTANAPFQPALTAAPNDWTMSVTYGACPTGGACGGLNSPEGLAIDGSGDVWVANYFGGVVSAFSPAGAPLAPTGYPGVGLAQSFGITIDPFGSVWVSNMNNTAAAGSGHHGSVSKFSPAGVELSAGGYTGGGVYYNEGIASDASGNIWVADYASSSASLLSNSGAALSPATGYAQSALPFTGAVAVDAGGNGWFSYQTGSGQGGAGRVTPAGAVSKYPCCNTPTGIAIDQTGNVWLADYGAYSIAKLSAAGTLLATTSTAAGPVAPQALAVDGGGTIWAANYIGDSVTELNGATAALLSPVAGFGRDAPLSEPYAIAVDASGNLWLSNSGNNTVTEIVGVAAPIRTPLTGPPAQP